MKLHKLRVKNFKSIYDELTVDFSGIVGFWGVGGPVGSGKTTIGEAIIFGLFGTVGGKNNSNLISWGEKHASVEVWCSVYGHELYIKREINSYGQSPMIAEVDGKELTFTNKRDCQQQLEQEYYDITRTSLELLCIISFNNFKSLTTLNSSDTKKFLDQILGFYTISQYADVCKELRKEVSRSADKLRSSITNNQNQINKILELASISRIEGNIKDCQNDILILEQERDSKISEIDGRLSEERKQLTETKEQLSKIKTLGTSKKKEIDFIKKGICPTCGAPIDQSQLSVKESEREVLVDQYMRVSKESENIQSVITQKEQDRLNVVKQYREQISSKQTFLTQLKEQEKRSKISMTAIEELNNANIKSESELSMVNANLAEWDELYNILSCEIRAKILGVFIPTLNKNILKYTQQLHQRYVVEYDNLFNCSIKICGVSDNIPLNQLSTGQLKTVDMCVILGVLDTIKSNISFNISFMDELFSNMDAELRSTMCQVLKQNMAPGQTMFVISHVDLDSKYFDGNIITSLSYFDDTHMKSVYNIKQKNIDDQLNNQK